MFDTSLMEFCILSACFLAFASCFIIVASFSLQLCGLSTNTLYGALFCTNSCKILPFILKALGLSPLTPYSLHKLAHKHHESCRLLGKEDRYTLPIKHQQNLRQSHDAIATFFFIIGV
jgi:hypothetical protein